MLADHDQLARFQREAEVLASLNHPNAAIYAVERSGGITGYRDGLDQLAYQANDSGRFEICMRPLPEVNTGRWQVSTTGRMQPLWARSGQELFYVSLTGALMRVGVESGAAWVSTTPAVVVKAGHLTNPNGNGARNCDIASDGQRFLVIGQGLPIQPVGVGTRGGPPGCYLTVFGRTLLAPLSSVQL